VGVGDRLAWPEARLLAHIREQAGKHFDPQVVEAFLKLAEGGAGIKSRG
jgi:response regulator RpfG family c-di-GMP phosphodiesterase